MGKQKGLDDFLFLSFANSKLARKDIFDLLGKITGFVKFYNMKELRMMCDPDKIKNGAADHMNRLKEFEKFNELFSKKFYFPLTTDERIDMARSYLGADVERALDVIKQSPIYQESKATYLMGLTEFHDAWYSGSYKDIGFMFPFLSSLKFSQLKLKDIMKKTVSNSPLDNDSIMCMTKCFNDVRKREEIVLHQKNRRHMEQKRKLVFEYAESNQQNPYQFFKKVMEPAIYYTLVNFLCSQNCDKLKQCKRCKNFWVAKTNRMQRYCSNKCRIDDHNERRRRSGENTRYQRKWRAKHPDDY